MRCTKNLALAQREKALREPHTSSIHEVEELKRAQEIRIYEFSRHELRESQATFQELTSQIQELQERVNFMNDSREIQHVESICSKKLSNRDTISTPRFARRPSTMNSLFQTKGAYPQNHMADQQKLQISELQFDKFPTLSTFSCWKIRFKTQVSACSGSPSEARLLVKEVEMVDSVDDFKTSHSIQGYTHFPNFEMLDARITSALNKII